MLKGIPGSKRPSKTRVAVEQSYLVEEFRRIEEAADAAPTSATSHPAMTGMGTFEVSSGGWELGDLEGLEIHEAELNADTDGEPW